MLIIIDGVGGQAKWWTCPLMSRIFFNCLAGDNTSPKAQELNTGKDL